MFSFVGTNSFHKSGERNTRNFYKSKQADNTMVKNEKQPTSENKTQNRNANDMNPNNTLDYLRCFKPISIVCSTSGTLNANVSKRLN